jgi:hypothetical protein
LEPGEEGLPAPARGWELDRETDEEIRLSAVRSLGVLRELRRQRDSPFIAALVAAFEQLLAASAAIAPGTEGEPPLDLSLKERLVELKARAGVHGEDILVVGLVVLRLARVAGRFELLAAVSGAATALVAALRARLTDPEQGPA